MSVSEDRLRRVERHTREFDFFVGKFLVDRLRSLREFHFIVDDSPFSLGNKRLKFGIIQAQ